MEQENRSVNSELEELERKFIFATDKTEADSALAKIVRLLPNDYDLGEYIRNLYENKMWK